MELNNKTRISERQNRGSTMLVRYGAAALILAVLLGASAAFLSAGNDRAAPSQILGESSVSYEDPVTLVYESEAIVLAKFISETDPEEVRVPGSDGQPGTIMRTDVFRTFEITDVLKGSLRTGEKIIVWYSTGIVIPDRGISTQADLPSAIAGTDYALFLTRLAREDGTYWGLNDDPSFASISGQSLRFETGQGYKNAMAEEGIQILPESGAPFALDVTQLRELVQRNEAPPLLPTVPSGGTPMPTKAPPSE